MPPDRRVGFVLEFVSLHSSALVESFKNGVNKSQTKSDGSSVTELDKYLNREFIKRVQDSYPGEGVIGEETSYETNSKLQWTIDPIDGTDAFIMGSPNWGVSIALLEDGEPILGVIANLVLDRAIFAFKGGGAFRAKISDYKSRQKINVSDTASIKDARVFGFYDKDASFCPDGFVKDIIGDVKYYLDFYSFAEHGAYLAMGKADAVMFWWDTAYDIAPLKIIVEEAGGMVTDLFGRKQRYDRPIQGALLSNGKLHASLVEKLSKAL